MFLERTYQDVDWSKEFISGEDLDVVTYEHKFKQWDYVLSFYRGSLKKPSASELLADFNHGIAQLQSSKDYRRLLMIWFLVLLVGVFLSFGFSFG